MKYKEKVEMMTPKEDKWKNAVIAFIAGGVIGAISEILVECFDTDVMLVVWIVVASVFTGIGIFDDLSDRFKMGVIIPITGFSHSVSSSSLEYKREGLITGIGSNYFKLAGSVILYGIISATIFNLLEGLLCLL